MQLKLIIFPIFSIASALAFGLSARPARAVMPFAADCNVSAITSPRSGSIVAGPVEIRGRANVPSFQFYKIEYAPVGTEGWILIGQDVVRAPVTQEGRLVIWQTNLVPDGAYRLRMHVVDPSGNYCELFVQPITVSNLQPIATASPTPTLTPTETEAPPSFVFTAVPLSATPTFPSSIITNVVPVATPVIPGNRSVALPDINLVAYGVIFLLGACGMSAVVAIIFIVSRLWGRGNGN
jgi:hypothetical protein